jgi:nitroimidazol reductase NimA-like FMN-containing flavoprotein (pyridoxamine 5'-phosphate oxidase superfamily)
MTIEADGPAAAGRFEELTEAECQMLLGSRTVGRLGFMTADGPQIIPVNYVVQGSHIIFRTASYTRLGRDVPDTRVAFEIDDIDESVRAGWSVLAVGAAERIDDEDEALDFWDRKLLDPWAVGTRTLLIRIRVSGISGRRVAAP